jgi:hypothetical protein
MTVQSALSQPHVRHELQARLVELQADDPRPLWRAELEHGLASGIDEVFHFFFDDHDFDETDVGVTLFDQDEVRAIGALKAALNIVLQDLGDAGDDKFALHPLWREVRQAAVAANRELARRT